MISIRLWHLVAVSIVSGVFGGLISSAARISSIGNVVAAEQADEARTAMDKAEEKTQDRYAAMLEEAKERHAAMLEEAKKFIEVRAIRFADPNGRTKGILGVEQAIVDGRPTAQLILFDAEGKLVWSSAPQGVKVTFVSPGP